MEILYFHAVLPSLLAHTNGTLDGAALQLALLATEQYLPVEDDARNSKCECKEK